MAVNFIVSEVVLQCPASYADIAVSQPIAVKDLTISTQSTQSSAPAQIRPNVHNLAHSFHRTCRNQYQSKPNWSSSTCNRTVDRMCEVNTRHDIVQISKLPRRHSSDMIPTPVTVDARIFTSRTGPPHTPLPNKGESHECKINKTPKWQDEVTTRAQAAAITSASTSLSSSSGTAGMIECRMSSTIGQRAKLMEVRIAASMNSELVGKRRCQMHEMSHKRFHI